MSELESVTGWVGVASRRASNVALLEALALGLAGALAVVVAAVVSGASASEPSTFAVAAIGAASCSITWFLERRRSRTEIARRVDRKLQQGGAFVTAFEGESRGASNLFLASLVERVVASLSSSALARAIPWPSPAFAAAPLIVAAALAFAIEREPRLSKADAELLGRVAVGLSAAAHSSAANDQTSNETARVLAAAETLAKAAETRRIDPEAAARELAAADEALSELAEQADTSNVELRSARDLTSSALAQLAPKLAERGAHGGSSSSASRDADAGAPAVANGGAPRTMSRPADPAQPPMSVPQAPQMQPDSPTSEVGTVAGRWWSPRYDAIVTAFLDSAPAQR